MDEPNRSRGRHAHGACRAHGSDPLSATRALVALEEAGGGLGSDGDHHALQVSGTMKWLDAHVMRVLAGTATQLEQQAVARVPRELRVAKAWLTAQR